MASVPTSATSCLPPSESTDSKSRQNFLEVLRGPDTDSTINDVAVAYWQRQKLPQAVIARLTAGAQRWADKTAWQASLTQQQVTDPRHVRSATEGAVLGSLIAHGVSPELTVLSDGAGQFDVFGHALCWLHVERPLERLVPHNEKHRQAIEQIRQRIWELYTGLKAYRQAATMAAREALGKQFDELVAQRTDYPSIDRVLKGMAADRAKLLLVLERPEVPLHNNLSEGHIPGLREEAEAQRQHPQRVGATSAGHVCEPEEDMPAVGSELLGVSSGSRAWLGSDSAVGGSDPPESGRGHGRESQSRAAA